VESRDEAKNLILKYSSIKLFEYSRTYKIIKGGGIHEII